LGLKIGFWASDLVFWITFWALLIHWALHTVLIILVAILISHRWNRGLGYRSERNEVSTHLIFCIIMFVQLQWVSVFNKFTIK